MWAAHRVDALHQFALVLDILDNHFDDPIRLADQVKIIFQISKGDQLGVLRVKKLAGFACRRSQPLLYDAIAHGPILGVSPSAPLPGERALAISSRITGRPAFAR
jgi:hypothetical protein